ncbi:hypothetical protein C4565_04295 [Candidatus Parcubacteria bacterium]|jgi:hypothetical protein|nr:MAG: hypothetical protein C4565_04295 [Candidatus Parcubacteria bacterium]
MKEEMYIDKTLFNILTAHMFLITSVWIIAILYSLHPIVFAVFLLVIGISALTLAGMFYSELKGVFYRNFYAHINIPRYEEYHNTHYKR